MSDASEGWRGPHTYEVGGPHFDGERHPVFFRDELFLDWIPFARATSTLHPLISIAGNLCVTSHRAIAVFNSMPVVAKNSGAGVNFHGQLFPHEKLALLQRRRAAQAAAVTVAASVLELTRVSSICYFPRSSALYIRSVEKTTSGSHLSFSITALGDAFAMVGLLVDATAKAQGRPTPIATAAQPTARDVKKNRAQKNPYTTWAFSG